MINKYDIHTVNYILNEKLIILSWNINIKNFIKYVS